MRFRRRPGSSEWLGLGEASRLLGVAPGTLRRWSDSGHVPAFTTPGGHRRYRRSTLESLVPQERTGRPSLARSGMTPARLARAYRQEARAAARAVPWIYELSDEQRDWFRHHGRRLAEALLGYLEGDGDASQTRLSEATAEAAEYGRVASGMNVSLSQAVEGFLRFRLPFLHQLALVCRRRGFGPDETMSLMDTAERAMDRLLIAAMSAHSVEQVGRRLAADAAREGTS
jgi:excisionase family DNA binding protein